MEDEELEELERGFNETLGKAGKRIEKFYGSEGARLLFEPRAKEFFSIPKKVCYVKDSEMTQGRFMRGPNSAYTRDVAEAARELQGVGVIVSPDALCDLFQHGAHRLIGSSAHRQLTGRVFGPQPFFPLSCVVQVASSRAVIALYWIQDGRSVTSRWRFNQSEEE